MAPSSEKILWQLNFSYFILTVNFACCSLDRIVFYYVRFEDLSIQQYVCIPKLPHFRFYLTFNNTAYTTSILNTWDCFDAHRLHMMLIESWQSNGIQSLFHECRNQYSRLVGHIIYQFVTHWHPERLFTRSLLYIWWRFFLTRNYRILSQHCTNKNCYKH